MATTRRKAAPDAPPLADIMVCRESFTVVIDGKRRFYLAGRTHVRGDDPAVRLRPTAWRPAPIAGNEPVPA